MSEWTVVRRAYRALEPLHSFVYFAPESEAELLGTGLRPGRMPYLAQRSAAMGPVGAGRGHRDLLQLRSRRRRALAPAGVDARHAGGRARRPLAGRPHRALGRLLEGADPAEVDELAALAARVAAACRPEGRPLFAAHAEVEVPDDPLARLWQAVDAAARVPRRRPRRRAGRRRASAGSRPWSPTPPPGAASRRASRPPSRGWTPSSGAGAVAGPPRARAARCGRRLADPGAALREQLEVATDVACAAPLDVLDRCRGRAAHRARAGRCRAGRWPPVRSRPRASSPVRSLT